MATPTASGQLGAKNRELTPLLEACRDAYKISEEQLRSSIKEGKEVIDLYHNRQYTSEQLQKLEENGQPAETFNVIKMLSNAIIGYMETVVTTVNVEPRYRGSAVTALLLNDVVAYDLDKNSFDTMNKRIKLDGLLTGLMVVYEEVVSTGKYDAYGREVFAIKLSHIPSWQVRLDPQSMLEDYSDARYIHQFKWMPEEEVLRLFGQKAVDEMTEYYNHLDGDEQADYERQFTAGRDVGRYRQYDNYLIVKTIIEFEGKVWSVTWNDEFVLEKKEITFKKVRFPYRVVKMFLIA